MSREINFIEYNGQKILFVDFSNFENTDELLEQVHKAGDKIQALVKANEKDILMFTDINNSQINSAALSKLKEVGKFGKPILRKSALIGITGAKKTLLNIVNMITKMPNKAFDTKNEALDWLTS